MPDLTSIPGPAPRRGFAEAVRICLRSKYITFSGRASRSEFWFFWLATLLAGVVTGLLDIAAGWSDGLDDGGPLSGLLSLAVLLPSFAVTSRRFHDAGWRFWWYLLIFVPIFGWIFVFILLVLPPDPRPNQFDPA